MNGKGLDACVQALMRETAEAIILPRYQSLAAHEIKEKTPGDLVTIADHESEERLSEGLARLLPDAAIIGEEACAANPDLVDTLAAQLAWIIDPIDGTFNFANGQPPFALMIALVADGQAQAGWIYDPLKQRFCTAFRGAGAFINGEMVFAKESGATLPRAGISTLFMDPSVREGFLARAEGRMTLMDIPRCAGEQYPKLVFGDHDLALFERTLPWDHVPGALFLAEAGGKAARLDGSPYRFNDSRTGLLAASSPTMWECAAKILAG